MTAFDILHAVAIASIASDQRCKATWDFLDSQVNGDSMAMLNQLAQMSYPTEMIALTLLTQINRFLKPCPDDLKKGALICIVCSIEHAVRQSRL